MHTYARTRAELENQVMQIISTARSWSVDLSTLAYRQREGLNSVLPLGNNHVEVGRLSTTAEVAIQIPFATQEVNQEGGGYYGQNKVSSNLGAATSSSATARAWRARWATSRASREAASPSP